MLVRQVIKQETGMSRRACFALFRDGAVSVNGLRCEDFKKDCQTGDVVSWSVSGQTHTITVNDAPVTHDMIMFHKPIGYVVARGDRHEKTIYDLLPASMRSHYRYIGRLDKDTSGLLLLTTDGDIVQLFSHPRYNVSKTYRVGLNKPLQASDVDSLLNGERVGLFDPKDSRTDILRFATVDGVGTTSVLITIAEGKKRHIRRLFRHVGYRVRSLHRLRVGGLGLGSLSSGSYRHLTNQEVHLFHDAMSHDPQIS